MAWSYSSSPRDQELAECMYKTKTVHFFGHTTPIVLQNDNGPCPLLAICNVLLLRNIINLTPDIAEVSQQKLLSLVAEQLIDSNVDKKDAGNVKNQEENINDVIDLLPRLATGIDVNIKFRRIDDFEFTPERAIFALLDIPLYHGWIVDPQDYDTVVAIGSKSYNDLMEELVALETQNMEVQHKNNLEENNNDFPAANFEASSSSLSKARSFKDSPHSVFDEQIPGKGDFEENAEFLRRSNLSSADSSASVNDPVVGHIIEGAVSLRTDENMCNKLLHAVDSGNKLEKGTSFGNNDFHEPEPSAADDCSASGKDSSEQIFSAYTLGDAAGSSIKTDAMNGLHQLTDIGPDESVLWSDVFEKNSHDDDVLMQNEGAAIIITPGKNTMSLLESHAHVSGWGGTVHNISTLPTSDHEAASEPPGPDIKGLSSLSISHSDIASVRFRQTNSSGALASNINGSKAIDEGEERVLNIISNSEDIEPVYEDEVMLVQEADKNAFAAPDLSAKNEVTPQGELIWSFLRNNASQLTSYGLYCLRNEVKERELCVFFRNNHFSTMFKFKDELYLLVTDLGYLNQFDLVWEKLSEVNGDTLFMTGSFEEFKVESHENNTWDEDYAITSTADYLASIGSASQAGLDINSDLQLAIALQQQEFEQQPPHGNSEQSIIGDNSELVTGPQDARNSWRHSSPSSMPAGDSEEECTGM